MVPFWLTACLLVLAGPALAQAPVSLHAEYDVYAAGFPIGEVGSSFRSGPHEYWADFSYRSTGMIGFFLDGVQYDQAEGSWAGNEPHPWRFVGKGHWHGEDRVTIMDYVHDDPIIRVLEPAAVGRQPVPVAMQSNTIDTVSALAQMIRTVNETGRCEASAGTFDGRRRVDIRSWTVGEETLAATGRSIFAGKALRCEFEARFLAGFLLGDDPKKDARPRPGSAWMARVMPGGPMIPVRMMFHTDWVGHSTLYLTKASADTPAAVSR